MHWSYTEIYQACTGSILGLYWAYIVPVFSLYCACSGPVLILFLIRIEPALVLVQYISWGAHSTSSEGCHILVEWLLWFQVSISFMFLVSGNPFIRYRFCCRHWTHRNEDQGAKCLLSFQAGNSSTVKCSWLAFCLYVCICSLGAWQSAPK